jgi:hypothetical protein
MKRNLILNRILYEYDLKEQNKYLDNKINTIKPAIKSPASFKIKNNITEINNNKFANNKSI